MQEKSKRIKDLEKQLKAERSEHQKNPEQSLLVKKDSLLVKKDSVIEKKDKKIKQLEDKLAELQANPDQSLKKDKKVKQLEEKLKEAKKKTQEVEDDLDALPKAKSRWL